MKFSALKILIGKVPVGHLFRYGDIIRLDVDQDYANDPQRPILSLSMLAGNPEQDRAFLLDRLNPGLNSLGGGKLPGFFQNLLPEGILRTQIAEERGCDKNDHFDILAACGADLPGNVYAYPADEAGLAERIVTQRYDSLEVSVVNEPLDDGISLSGLQPKRALIKSEGRFVVARNFDSGHVIGKMPTAAYPLLPQVEFLSLNLAREAGVNACHATLQPMSLIDNDRHAYAENDQFLAVSRFDRDRPGRLHAEDFAQILSIDPENKYTGGSYADIALVMMAEPDLGEDAVKELVRRLAVSDLLGNYDFHLKNIGLLHHADRRIELSPAYDIVAYSAYIKGRGHALPFVARLGRLQELNPQTLRAFAAQVGMPEAPLRKVIKEVCEQALERWPGMIAGSNILDNQKENMMKCFLGRPILHTLMRRRGIALSAAVRPG